jgi:hypothetical protein
MRHPNHDEWDWEKEGNSRRAKFYQHHIVHAWIQAGNKIADEILKGKGKGK